MQEPKRFRSDLRYQWYLTEQRILHKGEEVYRRLTALFFLLTATLLYESCASEKHVVKTPVPPPPPKNLARVR